MGPKFMNPKSRAAHAFAMVLIAALTGFSVWMSARAADFVTYWSDENSAYIRPLSEKLKEGNPALPGWYIYPSFRYDLYLFLTAPDAVRMVLSRPAGGAGLRAALSGRVRKWDFVVRGRVAGAVL